MARKYPYNRCYELQGRSLDAARQLLAYIQTAAQREKPQNSGNLGDIQKSWQDFYARHLAALEKNSPEILRATGLLHAEVKVKKTAGQFARAYEEYPAIFMSPEQNPRFFMYAPVGHQGENFVPEEAVLKTGADNGRIDSLLFAGGWLGNAPIFSRAERGVPLPPGVRTKTPRRAFNDALSQYQRAEHAYIAAGASLAAVVDYETRLAQYDQKLDAAMKAVRTAVEGTFPQLAADYPHLGKLYINMTARDGDPVDIRVSVHGDGGMPVPAIDGAAFMLTIDQNREYCVIPRQDTPEGKELSAIMASVPSARPSLADYPELIVADITPVLLQQGIYKVLRYFARDGKSPVTGPDGALPFDVAALSWLMNDDADRRSGVVPPPMPAEVLAILARPLASGDSAPKKPPARAKNLAK